jgi:hypothetical protein
MRGCSGALLAVDADIAAFLVSRIAHEAAGSTTSNGTVIRDGARDMRLRRIDLGKQSSIMRTCWKDPDVLTKLSKTVVTCTLEEREMAAIDEGSVSRKSYQNMSEKSQGAGTESPYGSHCCRRDRQ